MYKLGKDEDLDLILDDEELLPVFNNTKEVCEKTSTRDSKDQSRSALIDFAQVNAENDAVTSFVSKEHVKKVHYERKFPGPAGLVRTQLSVFPEDDSEDDQNNCVNYSQVCSQSSTITFDSDSWQKLINDVHENGLNDVLDQWTISYIKNTLIGSKTTRKIPLFGGIIRFIDCTLNDPSVIFKDPSGEIRGTLHRDVWEQLNEYLIVGSSLLLQNVGVIILQNSRKLYLNVTKNNIIAVYNSTSDGVPPVHTIKLSHMPSAETISRNLVQVQVKKDLGEESSNNGSCNINKHDEENCSITAKKAKISADTEKRLSKFKSNFKKKEPEKCDFIEVKSVQESYTEETEEDIVSSTLEGIDVDSIFSEEF